MKTGYFIPLVISVGLLIGLLMGVMVGMSVAKYEGHPVTVTEPQDSVILLPEHPYYLLEEVNDTVLYETLKHYGFPHPEIITAQAVLESGNFKSRLCVEHNNLFGLYDSNKQSYMKFDSWISACFAYKKYILSKYDGKQNYMQFLTNLGYAEDMKDYSKKVNKLAKQYKKFKKK